ncbi:MAG: isoprenylcysteine carboxylmethyltransferase family protein [Rubrivivax sp.]
MARLVTLLYLIAFSGNLFVPRLVDVGPGAPLPPSVMLDLGLLVLFALQHSVMARQGFKRWWARIVPPVVERSTFVVATCDALGLLFAAWVPIAEPVVWRVESSARRSRCCGRCSGWLAAAAGEHLLIDHFGLSGLHQVFARLTGRPMPEAKFRTPLLYRYVRHPIYLGLLLGFWATPVMTAGHLLFAAGATAYILVGIAFEERDLVRQFGDAYRRYSAQVGMLVPWRSRG